MSSIHNNGSQPFILVLPRPSLYRMLFSKETDAKLSSLGRVVRHDSEQDPTSDELAEKIGEFDIVISGWRSPKFTAKVLDNARKLKFIAHSAGSVKFMLDENCFERGIKVSNVAAAMAAPVAEMTLMFIMLSLRPLHAYDRQLKS